MAKVGYEVEGCLQRDDILTLFIDAEEYKVLVAKDGLVSALANNGVEHLYICDHDSVLHPYEVEEYLDANKIKVMVTFEVTNLTFTFPERIAVMWNATMSDNHRSIRFLRHTDQVKVEHELFVLATPVSNFFVTYPEYFEGDIDVSI